MMTRSTGLIADSPALAERSRVFSAPPSQRFQGLTLLCPRTRTSIRMPMILRRDPETGAVP
jgi:hypothetical protein